VAEGGRVDCKRDYHDYQWSDYCGAKVCVHCGEHKGLERCYCGWSKTSPGRGREELEEMGETIEEI
jgi:hypothetical protein